MVFEHFAINVADLPAVRDWFCAHLGLSIRLASPLPPFMTFLTDSSGRVVMELYQREDVVHTDFSKEHHITFHVAFESENAQADKERLTAQGATFVEEVLPPDGSHLIMLRDPWGLPLQICQRTNRLNYGTGPV